MVGGETVERVDTLKDVIKELLRLWCLHSVLVGAKADVERILAWFRWACLSSAPRYSCDTGLRKAYVI